MLEANRNENPAVDLNSRAVNSLPSKTGKLPLPRGKLYPLTRSPLMGGTTASQVSEHAHRDGFHYTRPKGWCRPVPRGVVSGH
jgi:hypothetical protein